MMKEKLNKLLVLHLMIFGLQFFPVNTQAALIHEGVVYIMHDGLVREFLYYIPPTNDKPSPLLIDLHGFSNTGLIGKYVYDFYGVHSFLDEAKEKGFAVIWPTGVLFSWNATDCCPPANYLNIDDNGFLLKAVDKMKNIISIDETRVYVHGISNGGAMAHDLAVKNPKVFAAMASSAAPMYRLSKDKYPNRAIAQLEIHGTSDSTIKYGGGQIIDGTPFADILLGETESAESGRDTWAAINGCQGDYTREEFKHIYIDTYEACDQGTSVILRTLLGGEHTSTGDSKYGNSVKYIWSFLSQFTKPGHKNERMYSGQTLDRGQWLESSDGRFRFGLDWNRSLTLRDASSGDVIWKAGADGADFLSFSENGNLQLVRNSYWEYKKKKIKVLWYYVYYWKWELQPEKRIWQSGTGSFNSRNHSLEVDNNGFISIIQNGVAVWSRS